MREEVDIYVMVYVKLHGNVPSYFDRFGSLLLLLLLYCCWFSFCEIMGFGSKVFSSLQTTEIYLQQQHL